MSLDSTFAPTAASILATVAAELGARLETVGPSRVDLRGDRSVLQLQLSRGHAWQLSALVDQRHPQGPPVGAAIPLAFVLEALTGGVASHWPRLLKSSEDLGDELRRLAGRLSTHGRRIFAGEVEWPLARDFMQSAAARAARAASGRSKTARQLEMADLAFGRDDVAEAIERYERLGAERGQVETARLELLRARAR